MNVPGTMGTIEASTGLQLFGLRMANGSFMYVRLVVDTDGSVHAVDTNGVLVDEEHFGPPVPDHD